MKPTDMIKQKKEHINRLTNQNGANGEISSIKIMEDWVEKPKGKGMKILLSALKDNNIIIKSTSFDAISLPNYLKINFEDEEFIKKHIKAMIFIEIKTSNQERVKDDFSGFYFSITENEILASEVLGNNYKVALYNKLTETISMTSIPSIFKKIKSSSWSISIQL